MPSLAHLVNPATIQRLAVVGLYIPQLDKMMEQSRPKAQSLLRWYDRHRRDLPWRAAAGERPDPYAVWLSEIMLQQTTVPVVKDAYTSFLKRWPDVADLARASSEDVMKAWAGLGYYSRARNLHACAQHIMRDYQGRFPQTEEALRALPGIGPYTAAAIAAIAFDQHAIVIDGNVERVITRLFAINRPKHLAKADIYKGTALITPKKRSGDFAQAMMDLGSMICTPRSPSCAQCPWVTCCQAYAQGTPDAFPVKQPKTQRPQRQGAIFVARSSTGFILMRTRPSKGLLGGMNDFPSTDWTDKNASDLSPKDAPFRAPWKHVGDVEHVFSHFALQLRVYCVDGVARKTRDADHFWVKQDAVKDQALPSLMQKVWERAADVFADQKKTARHTQGRAAR